MKRLLLSELRLPDKPYHPDTKELPDNFLLLKTGEIIPVDFGQHFSMMSTFNQTYNPEVMLADSNTIQISSAGDGKQRFVDFKTAQRQITKRQREVLEDYAIYKGKEIIGLGFYSYGANKSFTTVPDFYEWLQDNAPRIVEGMEEEGDLLI